MPSQHRNPLLGWRPPAELSAWAREEAERRGVGVGVILTEALEAYRADRELLTQAEYLLTQLWKELLSVKPWLDKPYPDAPELSPWTRRSEALARRAHDLSLKLRAHLKAASQDSRESRHAAQNVDVSAGAPASGE